MPKMILLAVFALTLAGCMSDANTTRAGPVTSAAQATPSKSSDIVDDGRNIAEAQCAACHSVGAYGESPNPQAPVFRTILARYPADLLEEDLLSGIQVAHPMPDFQFNPVGVDSLIAYLKTIQEAP